MYTRLYVLRHRKSISCRPFIFFFFSYTRRETCSVADCQGDFRCDNYELLIRCYHFPFYNIHTHTLWHIVRSSTFSVGSQFFFLFFFRGCAVSHSAAAIRYIWSSRYTRIHIYFFLSLRFPQRTRNQRFGYFTI